MAGATATLVVVVVELEVVVEDLGVVLEPLDEPPPPDDVVAMASVATVVVVVDSVVVVAMVVEVEFCTDSLRLWTSKLGLSVPRSVSKLAVELETIRSDICVGVICPYSSSINATTPATNGAAIDVPERDR